MVSNEDHKGQISNNVLSHNLQGVQNVLMIMIMVLIMILPREDFQIGEREALAVCWRCFGRLGHSPGHDDDDDNGGGYTQYCDYEYDVGKWQW